MTSVELHYGSATDVGRVRAVNEDAHLASPPVFVVADGMGGHHGGDVASAIVAKEFAAMAGHSYNPGTAAEAVSAALQRCQRRIHEYAAREGGDGSRWYSGTTAVIAVLVEDQRGPQWLLANLGDSRAYVFAGGALRQISVDHSVVQELLDSGEIAAWEAATHPERHVITRALGGGDEVEADFFLVPLASADRVLLCSDGVTGMIGDGIIAEVLAQTEDPGDAADRVVRAAVAAGGEDNATAIVVEVVGSPVVHSDSERQRSSLEEKLGALP